MNSVISAVRSVLGLFNPRTKFGFIRLALLLIAVVYLLRTDGEPAPETVADETLPQVVIASVSNLSDNTLLELLGTVASKAQANLTSESSGRVTAVRTELGQAVAAGTIIAELENASAYAALLQAEGAYEAALAAAASSDVGVTSAETAVVSAKNAAVSAYQQSYSTVSSIIYGSIDQVFSDPEGSRPGLLISGGINTRTLNDARVALQNALPAWQQDTSTVTTDSTLTPLLSEAETQTNNVLVMADLIISTINADLDNYRDTPYIALRDSLVNNRSTLSNTVLSLNNAKTSLLQAEESLVRAELSGTGSEVSAANAQVKQALGSLRAAQANYNKTIFRTPIAGVVNVLDVQVGDFVAQQQLVASIANNDALEITVFLGERDVTLLSVGDAVTIEGNIAGTVTNIAQAINPQTKKVEVKIQTESTDLANGDTVKVSIERGATTTDATAPISVPLTAVKFTATDGAVFVVVDGKLESRPVTIGPVSGSNVTILEGISSTDEIVVDARGLSAGTAVEAIIN